jgi:selenocysteine-specific elongation factor
VRVRGVQAHGHATDVAEPGGRAALALAGVELGEVSRGATLTTGRGWRASSVWRADAELLADAGALLGPRTRVRLHLGTVEVGARIVAAGGPVAPGERRPVRVVLDRALVARAGDRFVLRSATPLATIGGGIVTDPAPGQRRVRPWPATGLTPAERLHLVARDGGREGVAAETLAVRLGVLPGDVPGLLADSGVISLGDRIVQAELLAETEASLLRWLDDYHAAHPLYPGAPLQAARAALAVPDAIAAVVVRRGEANGALSVTGAQLRRAGWAPRLGASEHRLRASIAAALEAAGAEPPSVEELIRAHGPQAPELLRLLERDGTVLQVTADRYWWRGHLERLLSALEQGMAPDRAYAPAELRDLLGISRKYLIPVLEYADRVGVTERRDAGRVLSRKAASRSTPLA